MNKIKSLKYKLIPLGIGAGAVASFAADGEQSGTDVTAALTNLNTTLTNVSSSANTLSMTIVALVVVGVVLSITIGWAKKAKRAV